jgi:hypothetical protein
MCDYSLMGVPNRLARCDEELVVHRFHTGTMGLASPSELRPVGTLRSRTLWEAVKELFSGLKAETVCAVCVPPGAQLLLQEIPQKMQREFGIGPTEKVKFTQTGTEINAHRDALTFASGRTLLLQSLYQGQRVKVLSLASDEVVTPVGERFEEMWRR